VQGVAEPFTLSAPLADDPDRARRAREFWALTYLSEQPGRLSLARMPEGESAAMEDILRELLDWRLAVRGDEEASTLDHMAEAPAAYDAQIGPVLWQTYDRPAIAPLFGATFNTGSWNQGIVRIDNRLILLPTLRKDGHSLGNHYENKFLDPRTLQWQSQTSTRKDSLHGRILTGQEPGAEVHLFIRAGKLRGGKAAPFTYCGPVRFLDWEGERPITVRFALPEAVPEHLWTVFGVRE